MCDYTKQKVQNPILVEFGRPDREERSTVRQFFTQIGRPVRQRSTAQRYDLGTLKSSVEHKKGVRSTDFVQALWG